MTYRDDLEAEVTLLRHEGTKLRESVSAYERDICAALGITDPGPMNDPVMAIERLRAVESAARRFVNANGGAGTSADDQLLDLKEALANGK